MAAPSPSFFSVRRVEEEGTASSRIPLTPTGHLRPQFLNQLVRQTEQLFSSTRFFLCTAAASRWRVWLLRVPSLSLVGNKVLNNRVSLGSLLHPGSTTTALKSRFRFRARVSSRAASSRPGSEEGSERRTYYVRYLFSRDTRSYTINLLLIMLLIMLLLITNNY